MKRLKLRYRYNRKRVAKRLLPLFAPLILTPVATPVGGASAAKPDTKRNKDKMLSLKIMKFDQVAYGLYEQLHLLV